ncbi:protein ROOT INITIATION DEFECTIVE 3-like isoform X2 [Magnolia sinica]|uniref:protein ROOT INITIATION DEFECTIVE 3-like isoform X2 n=1 Tax=Magnolia sinica TaxID=86752 RepID=UPI00265ACAA5|nr:protein ROOT INITIATION DEFECTIVE 3-like isoform X2 [Magnolia sinica]
MAEMDGRGEAIVACSDKHTSAGICIWDVETGEDIMHIPTCASSSHGLLSLTNHFLVASQLQKHGSYGGGAIFIWPLNKPQALLRSYPIEPIGPISCTRDGLFLFGGAPSGNVYVWDVSSGRLLKNWRAHHKSMSCLALSDDDSFLISGADDGGICVWTLIRNNLILFNMICCSDRSDGSVLDMADSQIRGSLPSFHCWLEHGASITGLLLTSGSSSSVLISSSLDGTCKVWDLAIGRLLQTHTFSLAVTAIVLDPTEQFLFCGSADGRIFVNALDIGLQENPPIVSEDHSTVLSGHKGSITALSFTISGLWLISASEDCTACLWDVSNWQITRRFSHKKGRITNLVVIPRSSLSVMENQRSSPRIRASLLEKAQMTKAYEGTTTLLPTYCSLEDHLNATCFRSSDSLNQQILDLEGRTPEAIQMKVETSVENRLWAVSMTKHLTTMNKHLRSRLLDLMERRLSPDFDITIEKRKRPKVNDPEGRSMSPA